MNKLLTALALSFAFVAAGTATLDTSPGFDAMACGGSTKPKPDKPAEAERPKPDKPDKPKNPTA